MKRQYKIHWEGKELPGTGVNTVHADSEKDAKEIAIKKYPNVIIEKVELIK